ncbi:MAG: nucleotide exchange factor GrpE [Actinobacteria bacterium]|nr:nucleotide exchange factor GrpE [Actinomycetota bacterium]
MTDHTNDQFAPEDPEVTADEAVAAGPEGVETTDDEMTRVATERDEYLDQLQRTRADFDNYRKRMERERPLLQEAGVRDLVGELLPVLDNLERALEALVAAGDEGASGIVAGVDMVHQHLGALIAGRGVQEIPAAGEQFDPTVHEAVQSVPSPDHPAGTVVAVVERGYRLSDTVIRPARVVVSGGDGGAH